MKKLLLFLSFLIIPTLSPAATRNWAIAGGSTVVGAAIGASCYLLYKKKQSSNKPINKVHLALSTFFGGISGLIGGHIFTHMFKKPSRYETDTEKSRKHVEEQLKPFEEELRKKHAAEKQQLALKHKKEQEENQKALAASQAALDNDVKNRKMTKQQADEAYKNLHKQINESSARHDAALKKLKEEADRTHEAQKKANAEIIALADVPGFVDKSKEEQIAMYQAIYKKYGLE